MTPEQARACFLSFPEACQDTPFGPDVSVFLVRGRMFGTLGHRNDRFEINLKCDPDQAQALRDLFVGVEPGYHMNKVHWNTVVLDSDVPLGEIERMIESSWQLVVAKLRKADRTALLIKFDSHLK